MASLSISLAEILILSGEPARAQAYLSAGLEWCMDAGLFGIADRGIDLLVTLLRSQQQGVLDRSHAPDRRDQTRSGEHAHV